jgi:hypothetical protein
VLVGVPGVAFVLVAVGVRVAVLVAVGVAVLVGVLVAVGVVPPPTFTVPVMPGCTSQKYANEPALLKVNEKSSPGVRKSESQFPVLVVVWMDIPALV